MKIVSVKLGAQSYEIRLGSGIIAQAGSWLKDVGFQGKAVGFRRKAVIITDANVGKLYGALLEKSLVEAGFSVTILEVPPGEEQKTLETASSLYDRLAASFAERSTLILALGGGVIGDLSGFVAATYMRGIPYVQVPTSLLAMVDSSIGGKTAVDRGKTKNLVGAFYQPKMVIADVAALKTLPQVELSNGLAEAIKMAAISDIKFFRFLEENMKKAITLDLSILEEIVCQNARQKAAVVGKDEKETGRRVILNYGHTIGHAVEAVSDFSLKHGQAVSIGMVAENTVARRLGLLPDVEAARIKELLISAGLPVTPPVFTPVEKEKVFEAMKHDKKVVNDKIRFVLLKAIGRPAVVDDIGLDLIREVLFG
jgi:3-dehydroquinate synthase